MGTITTYNRTSSLSNISSVLIYAQCQDILSNKQLRISLNPISIKLEQLSNFPVDIITENGFKYLYMKFFMVDRTIVTPYYAPNRIMYFEFVKCFLCEEFQLIELINFLTTKFLTVEIIGIRTVNVIESTFTSEQLNYDRSVTQSSKILMKEEILLGVVQFDISDLLRGFWEVKLTNTLIHPHNVFTTNYDENDKKRMKLSWKNSPLTTDILTSYNTSMKIKIRLAYDLRAFQKKILRCENILNRIFFNLNDLKLANDILNDVFFYNSSLLNQSYQSSNLKVMFLNAY
ncbi:uncharacterized protein LOC114578219 [Apis cerana]|uniref:uncharacterized protein LOC114578219 n=1 Tax=Apis cerana TaxID=7461 RepID=UPI002B22CE88|nr:uncharacterized protein LOC114578219 [Apis cerana]